MNSKFPAMPYQFWMVLMLSINFGVVFFDRTSAGFLAPFFRRELALNDIQIGMLSSGLSLTWALAGFGVGRLSDRLGRKKPVLVAATLLFCVCSFVSGLARSFLLLLATRVLMGIAEGGVMPVSHAVIVAEVDEERRGVAMGVAQNMGSNLLGSFVAPLALTWMAVTFGWRSAFFLAAAPGLVSGLMLWMFLREPVARVTGTAPSARPSLRKALAVRNIRLCALISILLVSYVVCSLSFMPLFLVQNIGYSPEEASWLMATLGLSATIGSFVVSAVSDVIGRRLTIIVLSFNAALLPLGVLYGPVSPATLAIIFFFGWAVNGVFPIFMATIPSESFDPRFTASLSGLVMGIGEIIGGVLSPTLAGWLSDGFGRGSVMWFMAGLCVLAGALGFGLVETAPRVLARHRLSEA